MRRWAILGSAALVLALGLALYTWSKPASPPVQPPSALLDGTASDTASSAGNREPVTRSSEGGGVTVKATWDGVESGPVFAVALDTHSVDLDRYDLKALATLVTDDGREVRASAWNAPKGGHHRGGTLAFPSTTADGEPVIGEATKSLTLIVRDVAGVPERKLKWEVAG